MNKIILLVATLIVIQCNQAFTQTYQFDNNHQLIEIKYDNGPTVSIQYDANGNRINYFIVGAPLPLTLLSFNAQKAGKEVLLTWTTTQEINTDRFEVEYSADAISFTFFIIVSARGNTSGKTNYSTIHCCPVTGDNFYRLKMIDKDGGFKYSEIKKVNFKQDREIKVYPNPVIGQFALKISITKPFLQDAIVLVYSSSGALVLQTKIAKGATIKELNIQSFAAGRYYITVSEGGEKYNDSFVKE